MPILAATLFGSRARGDAQPGSDVDLLFAVAEGDPRHESRGKISVSVYPIRDLQARARSGNLFLCHVLQEGRPLYDPDGLFPALTTEFRLRPSYEDHVRQAADLAWLLTRFGARWSGQPLLRRRIAWTVRTILIGRSAEAGVPVFAPEALAAFGPQGLTRRLIAEKDADCLSPSALENLRRFLLAMNLPDPLPDAADPDAYAELFSASDNAVGEHFLARALQREREPAYL